MRSDLVTLCVSLGGSHAEVGMMCGQGTFIGSGIFRWRARLPGAHPTAMDLAEVVAEEAQALLSREGCSCAVNLGIAFPGPRQCSGWASNNLTPDFRDGLPVESIFASCFRATTGREPNATLVVLDAQADAGGELYHPQGQLKGIRLSRGATVINVANGIAAGYVFKGADSSRNRIACTAPDFGYLSGGRYDEGSGHLGRHLVTEDFGGTWRYEYRPKGEIASEAGCLRMTDILSGPALAAKLALRLAAEGFDATINFPALIGPVVDQAARLLTGISSEKALIKLGQKIRTSRRDLSRHLLEWADTALEEGDSSELCSLLRDEFASWNRSFAGALSVWQNAPGWDAVSRDLVVTGGVGQRLCRRALPHFWDECALALSPGTRISRSILEGGCERAAWFFHGQAIA